jgi:60 kDa SS-A/Ro ribonucleoprotein
MEDEMNRYVDLANAPVPQAEPLDARQVANNAGGFVFPVDEWTRLDRFLVLGSDAPTYYQSARALTRENARCVERCYALDAERTVARVAEVSSAGRAPKNDAAIFALALGAAHPDVKVRQRALAGLSKVCRTATHLFQFVDAVRGLGRGWGRTLKRAVAAWYEQRGADALAYQAIKYRARESYTHKRLLQTAHPVADGPDKEAVYRWICGKALDAERLPEIVRAHVAAMQAASVAEIVDLVKQHRLPWEAIPTEATTSPEIWAAMLPDMGLTALVRNLGKMTAIGALNRLGAEVGSVVERLGDGDELKRARLHPFTILQALAVYRNGRGVRGELAWSPVGAIVDGLDAAFYQAFHAVEPTGKRTFIGLDVSSSMRARLGGTVLTAAEGAAAIAMVTMRREPQWHVMGFADGLRDLKLSARDSLTDVMRKTASLNFGRTDCALPMLHAAREGLEVDVFQVITDNETWAGTIHPVAALREYRRKTGIAAKLVVIGMTSTGFSIADPDDGGMLDVVGFDSAAPSVIADFARA